MELRVPLYILFYDVVIFLALAYIWLFFARRWNRYTAELRPFIRNAAVFIGLSVIGRAVDLLDDFVNVPYDTAVLTFLYGVSIVGVVYSMISYVLLLERSYLPIRVKEYSGKEEESNSSLKGAYVFFSSRSKMVEFFELIRSLKLPTLVFTRNPPLYEGMDNVTTLWITQASDKGVSPTKLHVIQDYAIKFAREHRNAVVVIDCLEYLLLYNDFTSVFKFLVTLKDHLIPAGSAFVVVVDGNAITEKQKAILLREFEPL